LILESPHTPSQFHLPINVLLITGVGILIPCQRYVYSGECILSLSLSLSLMYIYLCMYDLERMMYCQWIAPPEIQLRTHLPRTFILGTYLYFFIFSNSEDSVHVHFSCSWVIGLAVVIIRSLHLTSYWMLFVGASLSSHVHPL
jgi:hypothetical protein